MGRCLSQGARSLLLAVGLILLLSSRLPAADTYWQHDPATPGDWFVDANWTTGVPTGGDNAYIDNGGTAQILSGFSNSVRAYVGNGSVVHSSGSVTAGAFYLGTGEGSTGYYELSGDATLRSYLHLARQGSGTFVQKGGTAWLSGLRIGGYDTASGHYLLQSGTLDVASGPSDLSIQTNGVFEQIGGTSSAAYANIGYGESGGGTFRLTGGSFSTSRLTLGTQNAKPDVSLFELGGTGQLSTSELLMEYNAGTFLQTGGTCDIVRAEIQGVGLEKAYQISGGTLNVSLMYVGDDWYDDAGGTLRQSGGSVRGGKLMINPSSRYELSGSTLDVHEGMLLDLKGELDFTAPGGVMHAGENTLVNLSEGTILNAGNGAIAGESSALIIFPTGFDPATQLLSYSNAGFTHHPGETLTVPTGRGFGGRGEVVGHVVCDGYVAATAGHAIDITGGVEIRPGASIDLGETGVLTVANPGSTVTGGSTLSAQVVIEEGADLAQTGGAVTVSEVSVAGTYELSGGELSSTTSSIQSYADAAFRQTGGVHTAETVSVCELFDRTGTYELADGLLRTRYLTIGRLAHNSHAYFLQTGGTNITTGQINLGYRGDHVYELRGGLLDAACEVVNRSGEFEQSGGTNVAHFLAIDSDGRYNYTGGELQVGGWNIGGPWEFNSLTTTIHAADGAWIDFSRLDPAMLRNAENVSFASPANSLVVVEEGFDPAGLFKSYSHAGITHTSGSTLVVPAGVDLIASFVLDPWTSPYPGVVLNDHVRCAGSIGVLDGKPLSLYGGLAVLPGGSVDLGPGKIIASNDASGMQGEQLTAGRLEITSGATFRQTGGSASFSEKLWVESGTYELTGGVLTTGGTGIQTGRFFHTGGVHEVGGILGVGGDPEYVSNALYQMDGTAELRADRVCVGSYVRGKFIQRSGTTTAGNLAVVGYGQVLLAGGSLSAENLHLWYRHDNYGVFRQTGGTVTVSGGYFWVRGKYYLEGGQLQAENLEVFDSDFADFLQTGGSATVLSELSIRDNGSYHLTGGSLETQDTILGGFGSREQAVFVQFGGDHTVHSALSVGNNNTANALYRLQMGNLSAGSLSVGHGRNAVARFVQTGGTGTVAGDFIVAGGSDSTASYIISDGAFSAGDAHVGPGGSGTLHVSGARARINLQAYTQSETGKLISEIDSSGISPIVVSGLAGLGGTWTVLDSGAPYGVFDVLTAGGGISGGFDTVVLPDGDWAWGIDDARALWVKYALGAAVDIKPGGEPNSINLLAQGLLPVGILGSDTFDVSQIDQATLALAESTPQERGKSGNIGVLEDVNDDGFLDLMLLFPIRDLHLDPDATFAELTGSLLDGTPILGSDSVRLLRAGDANLDGMVDIQDFGILKDHFALGAGWSEGDFNEDGLVDIQDFYILKDHFDQGGGMVPTPEPATMTLLALGSIGMLVRRRRAGR